LAQDTQSQAASGTLPFPMPSSGNSDTQAFAATSGLPSLNPEGGPYKPLDLPQVATPGPTAGGLQDNPPPQNLGAASKAGGIAYMVDQVLRGAVKGYDSARLQHANQFNKKMSALSSLQQQLGQQYQEAYNRVGSSKVNPDGSPLSPQQILDDPEVKQLHNQVLVTHQATLDAIKGYLPPLTTDKKTGKQKEKQNLLQRMAGHQDNPDEALRAYAEVAGKLGPSALYQVKSPQQLKAEYEQRQTGETTSQAQGVGAGNQLTQQNAMADRNRVLAIPEDKRTPEDKQKLEAAESILAPQAKPSTAVYKEFVAPDGKTRKWLDVTHAENIPEGYSAVAVGAGANRAPKLGWTKQDGKWGSQLYDPETNQPIAGSFDATKVPPSSILSMYPTERTLTGKFVDSNGVLQNYSTTSTSHRDIPNGIGESTSGEGGAGQPAAHHAATPHAGTGTGAGTPSAGSGTHPVGYVGSVAFKDKQKAADKASAMSADLDTQAKQALADSAAVLKDPTNGPAKIGLVSSYLRNVVGAHPTSGGGASVRITNAEWQMAINSAPWLDRAMSHVSGKDGFTVIGGVTLTPQQALDMAKSVQQRAVSAKQEHSTLDAAAKAQKEADMKAGGIGEAAKTPAAATPQTKGTVSIADAMKKPKYQGKTKEQVSAAITAQGYTPVD